MDYNSHRNIKFTIEEQSNRELVFLYTLLKRNYGKNLCLSLTEVYA